MQSTHLDIDSSCSSLFQSTRLSLVMSTRLSRSLRLLLVRSFLASSRKPAMNGYAPIGKIEAGGQGVSHCRHPVCCGLEGSRAVCLCVWTSLTGERPMGGGSGLTSHDPEVGVDVKGQPCHQPHTHTGGSNSQSAVYTLDQWPCVCCMSNGGMWYTGVYESG